VDDDAEMLETFAVRIEKSSWMLGPATGWISSNCGALSLRASSTEKSVGPPRYSHVVWSAAPKV
jgi:hypothetical protein